MFSPPFGVTIDVVPRLRQDRNSKRHCSRESSRSRVCFRASSSGVLSPASIWAMPFAMASRSRWRRNASMDQVNPVIVQESDEPCVSFRDTSTFDAMVFRHVNDERMGRDKAEFQRNLTRFFDLQNPSVLNRVVALPHAAPDRFVRFESQLILSLRGLSPVLD